ncbi:LptF/LptG family permease [Hephaestia mangrovi]|uniref:LptF/LptG family permease n=1 Tax=Hephaestia mangrovi TaxID=2873268 RepID=UPI001CA78F98|nr:LptF/LptG family permease [Hephaestia mangrovi]MBY8826611.1 LptF/LptG family permease [Hephaestia mangrovi]
MKSIDRYMARLIAVPLLSTLTIAAMLLVLDRIQKLFAFVADEGGPISVIWRMLANLLPEYLGLGVPIGLLLGVLLTFRKLATTSELDVMRGVGMSYGRLLRVPFFYAIVLAIVNLGVVGFIQPKARYNYEGLRFELRTGALGASIKIGEFTNFGSKMTLRIEKSEDKGRRLTGIFLHRKSDDGGWLAVTAETGQFLATDDPDTIIFRLTNGTLIDSEPNFKVPRVLTFSVHDLPIPLPKYENFRQRGGRNLELTLPELAFYGHDQKVTPDVRASSRAEFHFRVVEVAIMFLLPMMGLALGVPPKRSTSALGVFLGIVMIVAYHKVNQYAADVAALGKINPIIGLWGPFAAFAGLILWMYYTIAYVPGGQPIGALERWFAKLGKAIGRIMPFRRRKAA